MPNPISNTEELQKIAGAALKIVGTETRYLLSRSETQLMTILAGRLRQLGNLTLFNTTLSQGELLRQLRLAMEAQPAAANYTQYLGSRNDAELLQIIVGTLFSATRQDLADLSLTIEEQAAAGAIVNPATGVITTVYP